MCDPVSILMGVGGLLGGRKAKAAPPPKVPEKIAVAPEAISNTGANVSVGGSAKVGKVSNRSNRKTTGSATDTRARIGARRDRELEQTGLSYRGKGTGIQIL